VNLAELKRLRSSRGTPCVSVLFPTHVGAPGSQEDHIRMRNLLDEARRRLATEAPKPEARKIMERLEKLASEVRSEATHRGLGLFANPEIALKLDLPFTVSERVVVDETFATRDLVSILNRSPRYWVLVLAEKGTRLLRGTGETVSEPTIPGFPMILAREEAPKRKAMAPPADRKKDEILLHFLQKVEKRVTEISKVEPHPLVLVGVERHLGHFREVAGNRAEVLATVEGSHAKTPAAKLAKLVWPQVEAGLRERTGRALGDLERAVHARKYASGVVETWRAASEGRVAELVVEEAYRQPARMVGGVLTVVENPEGPGVIDDAVDEVIEATLDKGGRVVFVGKGSLRAHQGIAAILRY